MLENVKEQLVNNKKNKYKIEVMLKLNKNIKNIKLNIE